ncbi:hypothetical protein DYU11_20855 [Fibrisoma montanum]|uniref:Uncharacterized protein n=1 Tax=Fibrisoma montanum TaxID=2305895 RepID=A0A418M3V4_9BACT|nr:hypothetical protein DYU11_20855 [Fibrisoma montanum]
MQTLWITQDQYTEALKGAFQMYRTGMPEFEVLLKSLDDLDTIQFSLGSRLQLPRYKRFVLRTSSPAKSFNQYQGV